EIELEMDPLRIGVAQQVERLVDQVVVVDQATALLLGSITFKDFGSDRHESRTAIAAGNGVAQFAQRQHAVLFVEKPLRQRRLLLGEALGEQVGARQEFAVDEDLQIGLNLLAPALARRQREPAALFLTARRASLTELSDGLPFRRRQDRTLYDLPFDFSQRHRRVDAERKGKR